MNLIELIDEIQAATHSGELEILDRVRKAWPAQKQFTPTQCALMIRAIEHERNGGRLSMTAAACHNQGRACAALARPATARSPGTV